MAFLMTRITAFDAQTIRVFFDAEPRHVAPTGINDALNRSNYTLTLVAGRVSVPRILEVRDIQTASGIWKADLILDRRTITGASYGIAVADIRNAADTETITPQQLTTLGRGSFSVRPQASTAPVGADLAGGIDGGPLLAEHGDLAGASPDDAIKARILRRLGTPRGGFLHLPDYGLNPHLSMPVSIAELQSLKVDGERQIRTEPGVVAVSMRVQRLTDGAIIATRVQTATGRPVVVDARRDLDGHVKVI